MDIAEYLRASELEREGKPSDAETLIRKLANDGNPFALFDLAIRSRPDYPITEGEWSPEKNMATAQAYADQALAALQNEAARNNGEAMRYLGAVYCGHYWPEFKNLGLVESQWLKAFANGCYFAANELFTWYQHTDPTKAAYWYSETKRHKCQVVYHPAYEPPEI